MCNHTAQMNRFLESGCNQCICILNLKKGTILAEKVTEKLASAGDEHAYFLLI